MDSYQVEGPPEKFPTKRSIKYTFHYGANPESRDKCWLQIEILTKGGELGYRSEMEREPFKSENDETLYKIEVQTTKEEKEEVFRAIQANDILRENLKYLKESKDKESKCFHIRNKCMCRNSNRCNIL